MTDEDLRERIRAAGLRATRSRVTVLRVLHSRSVPTSHPEVHEALGDDGWDRATLYRNLVDLTEAGLLRRVDVGDHVWRFELVDVQHADDAHPHFLCTACGEVSCLPDIRMPTEGVPRSIAAGDVTIQLQGLCDACYTVP
ncbi:MAG: transcriptional repressor [Myxococcales bacterium]|nr:transcriptional repressor [Myxococcales bacterium]MCB9670498.1 transcriptional repressor [Alphaproteobacteria bacterium]